MRIIIPSLIFACCAALVQGFDHQNITLRGNLLNSMTVFEKTQKGRVAFMGGSITEMDGYRPMVMEFLKSRFLETEFEFINAGISSTCSTTGAFRLERDVLSKGPIDLFFLEFAVNDDQDAGHRWKACIRGMEGIIRNLRTQHPRSDIIVTFFVNPNMLEILMNGEIPRSMGAHETVLRKYKVSRIHLARELASQISEGTFGWEKFGGTHPRPAGNRLCAEMHIKLLARAWSGTAPVLPQMHFLPPEPLDEFSYFRGRFFSPSQINLSKGWSYSEPLWTEIKGGKRNRYMNRPLLHASFPAAPLNFEFSGTAIGAFVLAGPDAGSIRYVIDGKKRGKVDLYHPNYSKGLHYPRSVIFAHDLAPGPHQIIIQPQTSKEGRNTVRLLEFCLN